MTAKTSAKAFLLAAAIVLVSCAAHAATYYVAMTGNNANDGSSANPWGTLQKAVDTIAAGDTIIVRNGTYAGCRMRYSGTSTGVKTLKAENKWGAIINAPGPNAYRPSNIEIIHDDHGTTPVEYWVVDGLEITNSPKWGIDLINGDHCTIRNVKAHNSSITGIFTAQSDYGLIEDCVSYSNGEHGFYVNNSADNGILRRNIGYSNTGLGVHMNGDIASPGDGIMSGWLLEKNMLYNNGANGFDADGCETTVWNNNICWGNTSKALHLAGGNGVDSGGAVMTRDTRAINNTLIGKSTGFMVYNIYTTSTLIPGPSNNKVFNNILYNLNTSNMRGAICTTTFAMANGFESDYNVITGRQGVDDNATMYDIAGWRGLGYDTHSIYIAGADVAATIASYFVNPASNDYHLKAGSPAIDAGKNVSADVTDDFDGAPRPVNGVFDIGAFEYGGTVTPKCVAPTFTPPAGTYSGTQSITISTLTIGAAVRYTTNGTDPTASSTLYTVPVSVSSSKTLKARAFLAGYTDSDIATADYVIGDFTTVTFQQGLSGYSPGRIRGLPPIPMAGSTPELRRRRDKRVSVQHAGPPVAQVQHQCHPGGSHHPIRHAEPLGTGLRQHGLHPDGWSLQSHQALGRDAGHLGQGHQQRQLGRLWSRGRHGLRCYARRGIGRGDHYRVLHHRHHASRSGMDRRHGKRGRACEACESPSPQHLHVRTRARESVPET